MPFILKKNVAASILVAVSFGLLLANLLSSLATVPRASVIGVSTVSPFAMMVQAPVNLPVEQYDTH
jgi:hypothetical protein